MILKSEKDFKAGAGVPPVLVRALGVLCLGAFFFLSVSAAGLRRQSPVISGIEVWVDGSPGQAELESLISIREGHAYSLKKISEAIKQIWKTGLFSDVQVLGSGDEQVRLKFMLTRRLQVRKIRFRGNKGLPVRKLNEALSSFRADGFFSEEKLARAVEELRRTLRQEGYFEPAIEPAVERLPGIPEADLTFTIAAGQRLVIESIQFSGNGVIPEKTLRKEMKSREGEMYVPSRLEKDLERLKNIYVSAGYRRAEVGLAAERIDRAKQKVSLAVNIVPQERIDVVIRGARVPSELVEPIWEERIFEEWGIREGEARVLSYLRERGHIFASISSSIEAGESEIRVVHEVEPGDKYRVQEIRFEGIEHFSPDQLKEKLGIAERFLFLNLLDGGKVFALPEEIRSFYQSQGFADVRVDLNFLRQDNKVTAVYYVQEGDQEVIQEILIQGATLFDAETLRTQMDLAEGGPFFAPAIQRDIQRLEAFYLNQGIRDTRVDARTEAVDENAFRVILEIQEGHPKRIRNIIVVGNSVTKMHTILRELEVQEGDPSRYDSIMASKRNLENLGIFSEVRVEELSLTPEEESLVITVREGERNYAGLGIGLETKNEPLRSELFDVALRLRGTAEFMRSNIFGRAASLSFVSQFSLAEKRAVISWEQPYFLFDFPMDTYLNAWVEEEDRQSFGFEREGISISGIRPAFRELTLLLALRYARTTLTYLEVTPSEIDRQFFPYSTTSVSSSLIREKRNDPFNPERGSFSSLAFEWAFPLFETESDFLKAIVKHQLFVGFVPGVNLSSTFRLGLGMGRMPIHERFFAGGSNSFRGERFDELGPRDPASRRPVGGKALFLLNLELTFPVFTALRNLSGTVFYDMGQVFYNRSDFDFWNMEHALGLGLRYRTPLGPLRFELGWNLSEPARRGRPLAFITIGHVF